MPADDQMTLPERLKYLRLIQPRYRAASRAKRSAMLTEPERITRLHRKSLIRGLGGDLQPRPGAHGSFAARQPVLLRGELADRQGDIWRVGLGIPGV